MDYSAAVSRTSARGAEVEIVAVAQCSALPRRDVCAYGWCMFMAPCHAPEDAYLTRFRDKKKPIGEEVGLWPLH